jgi:D-serine deaminase-like pyridoxal phosphate-dependent protein
MLDRPTPYLLVDPDVLSANVQAMARFARDRGLLLRPHAKTHKTPEIARLQLAAGATGLTVATVSEAEAFAAAGVTDLFLAYPLWVDPARGARLRALTDRVAVRVGIDSVEGARALAAQVPGCSVMVEVDSGQHRSGVQPAEAGVLAECAVRTGLDVHGVFSFPGHSYAPGIAVEVAGQESAALRAAVGSLAEHGIAARVVSGGSTPSASEVDSDVLTEMRPGVYVFNDAQQWELGTVGPEQIALSCRATVVSHAGGRLVLDSGSKMLGADRAAYATGYGRLPEHPAARVVQLSEHHAVVDLAGTPLPALGSRVDVVPNHVCNAVNLVDDLWADTGDGLLRWPVAGRGRNS